MEKLKVSQVNGDNIKDCDSANYVRFKYKQIQDVNIVEEHRSRFVYKSILNVQIKRKKKCL